MPEPRKNLESVRSKDALAITLAQVAGVIPVTRLGRTLPPTSFLRLLVIIRTAALVSIALLAALGASFAWLVPAAAVAGSVNGAAFGYLRSVLNQLTPPSRLPRALGIAATLNEVCFVAAPVMASGLGTVSPVMSVLALALLGALPAVLVPRTRALPVAGPHHAGASPFDRAIMLWLLCAASVGAAVAAIEIGAVELALRFGHGPAMAILFTIPLCLASVTGGIWVSVRNRMATRRAVVAQLCIMTTGSVLAALEASVAVTVVGTVLIGIVLAPLGTYTSLVLDALAPPQRRAEVFALLRVANATGIILASGILTTSSLSLLLQAVTGLLAAVTLVVAAASLRDRGGRA